MNELTKIKDRILARIEEYIEDMEMTEVLTFDEKTTEPRRTENL